MDRQTDTAEIDRIELTVDIVAAYVSNNSTPVAELVGLIGSLYAAIGELVASSGTEARAAEKATPAQIRKSIAPDQLISFEDGKPYKTLRRHLTLRGLSPEAYREKWGLPRDYPMTAATYSAQRSELARSLGLGQQRRKPAPAEPEPAPAKRETRRKAGAPVLTA